MNDNVVILLFALCLCQIGQCTVLQSSTTTLSRDIQNLSATVSNLNEHKR